MVEERRMVSRVRVRWLGRVDICCVLLFVGS
jgi:hypothetical protein